MPWSPGRSLMRWVLAAWAVPMGLFWGWYFLSYNDMNFGYVMLTRDVHDILFQLYGNILGVEPATIPGLVAKACILDTFIILGIWAFRRRKAIAAWYKERRGVAAPPPVPAMDEAIAPSQALQLSGAPRA